VFNTKIRTHTCGLGEVASMRLVHVFREHKSEMFNRCRIQRQWCSRTDPPTTTQPQ